MAGIAVGGAGEADHAHARRLGGGDAVHGILDDEGAAPDRRSASSAANRNTSGAGLGLPVGVSSAEKMRPSKKRLQPDSHQHRIEPLGA